MATQTETATDTKLELTPPDPVPVVAPAQASGLVPVAPDTKSKLDEKVEGFISELVAPAVSTRMSGGSCAMA